MIRFVPRLSVSLKERPTFGGQDRRTWQARLVENTPQGEVTGSVDVFITGTNLMKFQFDEEALERWIEAEVPRLYLRDHESELSWIEQLQARGDLELRAPAT